MGGSTGVEGAKEKCSRARPRQTKKEPFSELEVHDEAAKLKERAVDGYMKCLL